MQFFTPELYIRTNSPDDAEADAAYYEWEDTLVDYRKHLSAIRARLTPDAKKLSKICLHDAELISCGQVVAPRSTPPLKPFPFGTAAAVLTLKRERDAGFVTLTYLLWDRMRIHPARKDWRFATDQPLWLYEELDVAPGPGRQFYHRILLSDGRVLEIPFAAAFVQNSAE